MSPSTAAKRLGKAGAPIAEKIWLLVPRLFFIGVSPSISRLSSALASYRRIQPLNERNSFWISDFRPMLVNPKLLTEADHEPA